jgi:hypothetical protein
MSRVKAITQKGKNAPNLVTLVGSYAEVKPVSAAKKFSHTFLIARALGSQRLVLKSILLVSTLRRRVDFIFCQLLTKNIKVTTLHTLPYTPYKETGNENFFISYL